MRGVVQQLLADAGVAADAVAAIGAHGQTVRHRPGEFDEHRLHAADQQPALLAELTGIDVVADFRSRDLAAGGQGAPLVPAFHRALFAQRRPGGGGAQHRRHLQPEPAAGRRAGTVLGFDCGPGNALMDHWCQSHIGQPFDAGGQWAASGQVLPELLARLLAEPYFAKPPPKSTGRDLFNPDLAGRAPGHARDAAPADVQATLAELTASACAADLQRHGADSQTLIVCGGGALNDHLMARLRALLPARRGGVLRRARPAAAAGRGRGLRLAGARHHAGASRATWPA